MSLVAEVVFQSDESNRLPNEMEIRRLEDFFSTGEKRLRIAKTLAENEQRIVQQASQKFWQRCPKTPSNSGNPKLTALCQRDQGWYIRLVAYCVLAGNGQPMEEIGVIGMRDMYISLGVPLANLAIAMTCVKKEALDILGSTDAAIAAPYFDQIIRALS